MPSSGDLRQREATAIQRADKKTYKSFYGKEEKEKINLDWKNRIVLHEETALGAGHQKDMRETLARQKVKSIGSVVRERLLVDYKSHKGHIDATISVNSYRDEPPDKYIGDTQGEPEKPSYLVCSTRYGSRNWRYPRRGLQG